MLLPRVAETRSVLVDRARPRESRVWRENVVCSARAMVEASPLLSVTTCTSRASLWVSTSSFSISEAAISIEPPGPAIISALFRGSTLTDTLETRRPRESRFETALAITPESCPASACLSVKIFAPPEIVVASSRRSIRSATAAISLTGAETTRRLVAVSATTRTSFWMTGFFLPRTFLAVP